MRKSLSSYWPVYVVILAPILTLPIVLSWHPKEGDVISRTAYVVAVMAVYWVTEAIPLPVTALIPLLAFPILKITPAKVVAKQYLTDSSWLFIGSLIVAVAVEDCNLHRRIALSILRVTGSQTRWLMLGIMSATAVLSMFISNTATTAMMVPVVMSLGSELIRTERHLKATSLSSVSSHANTEVDDIELSRQLLAVSPPPGSTSQNIRDNKPIEDVIMEPKHLSKSELKFAQALLLAVSYSASIGGTATLTGTPPNIVMNGFLDNDYGSKHPINYATWMMYNFPGMIINILFAWNWLQLLFLGSRALFSCHKQSRDKKKAVQNIIRRELNKLEEVTFAEKSLLCWFVVALLLWLTREVAGWGKLFNVGKTAYVSDGTCIIFVVLTLFVWPRHFFLTGRCRLVPNHLYKPLITWQVVEKKLPWGVVLLLGGGFAMANAVKTSGLSKLIAVQLASLDVHQFWVCLISLIMMTYLTEFTSNTATSQIILPITMSLAEQRCINPLYLTMPVSEAASFAYMLPVATPPNAIVFSAGLLHVVDMIKAGSVMNLFCMLEVLLSIHTWGWKMFGIDHYPDWGMNAGRCLNDTILLNSTISLNSTNA